MLLLAGVASSALSYVASLQQLGQSQASGNKGQASSLFSVGNDTPAGGPPPMSSGQSSGLMGMASDTMNALFSAQSQATSPSDDDSDADDATQAAGATSNTAGAQTPANAAIEKLIQQQAQSLMPSLGQSVSMNV
jgi:hypothetical protein